MSKSSSAGSSTLELLSMPLNGSSASESTTRPPTPTEEGEAWRCQFCGVDGNDLEILEEPKEPPFWWTPFFSAASWHWLAGNLESHRAHVVVIVLTMLDLAFVLTGLSLSTFYPIAEHQPHAVEMTEDVMAWLSISILSIFTVEQLLKLAVFGPHYFVRPWWHTLDAVIIVTSLVLESVLRGAARETVSLLIIFRLWRLVRVMHGVAEGLEMQKHEMLDKHHRLEREMLLDLQNERKRVRQLEIEILKAASSSNAVDSV